MVGFLFTKELRGEEEHLWGEASSGNSWPTNYSTDWRVGGWWERAAEEAPGWPLVAEQGHTFHMRVYCCPFSWRRLLFQGEVSHIKNRILSTRVYSSQVKHVTSPEITRSCSPGLRILEPCWPLVYLFDNIKKSIHKHHPEGNHSWCKCFSLQKHLWISEHGNPGKGQRHFIWQLNIIYNFYR